MRATLTLVVEKSLTGYSYFCDFFAFSNDASALSSALMVNASSLISIVEKSSGEENFSSHSCLSVMVYTATLADALKPSARYACHKRSFISPTNTNSVENERITPE